MSTSESNDFASGSDDHDDYRDTMNAHVGSNPVIYGNVYVYTGHNYRTSAYDSNVVNGDVHGTQYLYANRPPPTPNYHGSTRTPGSSPPSYGSTPNSGNPVRTRGSSNRRQRPAAPSPAPHHIVSNPPGPQPQRRQEQSQRQLGLARGSSSPGSDARQSQSQSLPHTPYQGTSRSAASGSHRPNDDWRERLNSHTFLQPPPPSHLETRTHSQPSLRTFRGQNSAFSSGVKAKEPPSESEVYRGVTLRQSGPPSGHDSASSIGKARHNTDPDPEDGDGDGDSSSGYESDCSEMGSEQENEGSQSGAIHSKGQSASRGANASHHSLFSGHRGAMATSIAAMSLTSSRRTSMIVRVARRSPTPSRKSSFRDQPQPTLGHPEGALDAAMFLSPPRKRDLHAAIGAQEEPLGWKGHPLFEGWDTVLQGLRTPRSSQYSRAEANGGSSIPKSPASSSPTGETPSALVIPNSIQSEPPAGVASSRVGSTVTAVSQTSHAATHEGERKKKPTRIRRWARALARLFGRIRRK